jgi:hypothetical protein
MVTILGYHELASTPRASRSLDCKRDPGGLEKNCEAVAESGSSWPLHCGCDIDTEWECSRPIKT